MKTKNLSRIPRILTAMMAVLFLMGFCFAGGSTPTVVIVRSADELTTELALADARGDATIMYYTPAITSIDLSGSVGIPSNVTLDLSATGGTLRVVSGGVLDVAGTISGGALEVSGGTLLRESGSSITATITTSSGGVVRGARVLSLENLDLTSTETITAINYAGLATADTSSYVTRAATATLFVRMTGSNFTTYQAIESVVTSAGNVFRLGTKYTETLSLTYALTYGGLTGATLTALNPTSYTASDAAILLNNPTKEGFLFVGWNCEALGITTPTDEMVIPEGTTGELTFVAIWIEAPAGGGTGGGSGSGSTTTTQDAQEEQETATAQEQQATTTQSTRRTRTASSSTKVNFTSDVETVLPTAETLSESESFPWGWTFGGLAALGIVVYFAARRANRRQK